MTCPRCHNESCICVCEVCRVTPMREVSGGCGNVTADGRMWCGCPLTNRSDDMTQSKPGELERERDERESVLACIADALNIINRQYRLPEVSSPFTLAMRDAVTQIEYEINEWHGKYQDYKHKYDSLTAANAGLVEFIKSLNRCVTEVNDHREKGYKGTMSVDAKYWMIESERVLKALAAHPAGEKHEK